MNLFQRECARKNYQAIPINDKNDADKYFLFALVDEKNSNGDIFSISDKAGIAREFLLSTGSSLSIDIAGDKKINVLVDGQLLRTIDFSYEKDGVNIDFCYISAFDEIYDDENFQLYGIMQDENIHRTILESSLRRLKHEIRF